MGHFYTRAYSFYSLYFSHQNVKTAVSSQTRHGLCSIDLLLFSFKKHVRPAATPYSSITSVVFHWCLFQQVVITFLLQPRLKYSTWLHQYSAQLDKSLPVAQVV